MPKPSPIEKIWSGIGPKVLNAIKVFLLQNHINEIILHFNPRLEYVIHRYAKVLPKYVAESELDDLRTVAQLELIESLKVWDPDKSDEIWPLAQTRIIGAMKDHIRYITKTDPSRFYDWITDAAYVFMVINNRADFEHQIETGVQLNQAMKALSYREKTIVISHTKDDQTFKTIGDRLGISESQISRIYKKAIEKIKKELDSSATG